MAQINAWYEKIDRTGLDEEENDQNYGYSNVSDETERNLEN